VAKGKKEKATNARLNIDLHDRQQVVLRLSLYSTRFCGDLVKEAGKMIIKPQETTEERLRRICNFDVERCPHCKKGRLVLIKVMPRIRSPGSVPVVCQ
jgi:hypothetical protein